VLGRPRSLFLQFGALKIRVRTNRSDYFDYLKMYFGGIQSAEEPYHLDLDITASWEGSNWNSLLSSLVKDEAFLQIGDNTFLSRTKVVTLKKIGRRHKVLLEFEQKGRQLFVNAHFPWKGLKDSFRHTFLSRAKEEVFFALTYPLVYYPAFWYLENNHKTHFLHASAIQYEGKGILFCGLEGIGKTSLALSLIKDSENARFLSDNLVLYDSQRVYPCYELIRVHGGDQASFLGNGFEKVNAFKTLKDYYQPPVTEEAEQIPANIFILPAFGSEFSIKELKPETVTQQALALSHIPSELGDYEDYRNLSRLLNPNTKPWEEQTEVLNELLSEARCVRISMPKADGLEANVERVRKFIQSVK